MSAIVQKVEPKHLIMGVVNITPDSFSDGGTYLEPNKACDRIFELFECGADIVDLGAESSRPGAHPVSLEEEWQRLHPILSSLSRKKLPGKLSLDTYKAEIMVRALDFPVDIINDIRGGVDEKTLRLLASQGKTYLAMHMHRSPVDMQIKPLGATAAQEACQQFFIQTTERLLGVGFDPKQIWLDPGIGFGKTDAANLQVMKMALNLTATHNVVLGVSRKSFLGRLLSISEPHARDPASKMLELAFLFRDVRAIRTHDVRTLRAIRDVFLSND